MIAVIKRIETGLIGQGRNGDYEYMDFTYQGEPYQGKAKDPTTRKVFANLPIHDEILEFRAGDTVDLTFEKNGKYSNLVGIRAAGRQASTGGGGSTSAQSADSSTSAPTSSYKSNYPSFEERVALDKMKDASIQRQVALKAAVDLELGDKAKGKAELENILRNAKEFAEFLRGNGPKADAGADEPCNPEDDPTCVNPDDDIPF
jgi:hypothetical protein